MRVNIRRPKIALAAASLLLLALPFSILAADFPIAAVGFVYVMTNQAADNTILVFQRKIDGSLSKLQEVSTQGKGTGTGSDPLGSQGALTSSDDGHLLLAADAGSNEISSLAVTATGLQFVSKAPSGGVEPVSVAVRGDTVYVLNAGGTPNVTVFRLDFAGHLTAIPGSTKPLPGGANSAPAQVGVTPDGEVLVVTEKNTNLIDLFPIDSLAGTLGTPSSVASAGATPFGFTFGFDRTLIVSEAANSTFSTYQIVSQGSSFSLQTVTKALPDGGSAACWIVRDGFFAYATNSSSDTISSFVVLPPRGNLELVSAVAATIPAGTVPIDMALTRDGAFLYAIGTGNGSLTGWRVLFGKLSPVTSISGLPLSIQGIVAR